MILVFFLGIYHCYFMGYLCWNFQDKKPTFSCSVVSNHVKDMLWIKDSEQSFIVVTDRGEMYHGAIDKPLTCVMEKVDAG